MKDYTTAISNIVDMNGEIRHAPSNPNRNNPFNVRPANEWLQHAATKPIPRKLFGDLWIEGELSVLFAPTNAGKSIFAVQIADCITKGISWGPIRCQAETQPVILFDFELPDRKFTRRYSEEKDGKYINLYNFSDKFFRAEPVAIESMPEGQKITDFYLQWIETALKKYNAKTIIIDNITWINSKLEKAVDAGPFMQQLVRIKRQYDLSILMIAHTPKRDTSREIDIYDLQGSSMLSIFLDSCFAINKSRKDQNLRYIKQVKTRDGELIYHEESVITCILEKEHNFTELKFQGFDNEKAHLNSSDEDKKQRDAKIFEYHRNNHSYREIAEMLGIGKSTVERIIKSMPEENDDFLDDTP